MTLGFSTKWPKHMGALAGKANLFTNKIIKSMWESYPKEINNFIRSLSESEREKFDIINPFEPLSVDQTANLFSKRHTIRHDPYNRWRVGMDIHSVINNRTKNRLQFAPVVTCKSVQEIEIINAMHLGENNPNISFYDTVEIAEQHWHYALTVKVDGKILRRNAVDLLAINDGFESVWDFFRYFNKDFKGKIIHWTDLKY